PSRLRGITLLELLVALAILALLSLLGYRAISALAESEVRLADETRRWRTLDALFVRLESDLREAIPRDARMGAAPAPAWLGVAADAGNATLEFPRAGPEFAADVGSAGQRIGYRYNQRSIEVLYWPYLDNVPAATPSVYRLADHIAGFRTSYLDNSG